MTRPVNPYIAGNPLRGEKGFFGRQDVLQWVARELHNPDTNALVLAGQRRIGKTSLLLQLERTLPSDVFLPIYFDLQDKAALPLGQVLAELAGKIARRIRWELPNPSLFDDQGIFFQNSFLTNLYQVLSTNCRPVLLFDEFDAMDQETREDILENAAAKALFSFLRSLMITDPRPAFVFTVGRQAEDLSLDFDAIFKVALRRDIWVLDRESARFLVRSAEANGTLCFTDEAVSYILNLTSGHPYLTQLLCQRIWERAYSHDLTKPPAIDIPDVKEATSDTLEVGHQALIWLWNGLNPAEKIYASALAEAAEQENEIISEDQVIQVLMQHAPRLRTREVELAPHDLVKHWVLERAGKQGYRFSVELLRLWVRYHKPLQDVKNELDQIEPLAEKFYEIGQEVLRRGNIEDAISNFRRALEANPKHLRALLDLSEIFLRQGRVSDAISTLQDSYKLDSVETRLPLARACLAQAKAKMKIGDDEGALAACVRALELSPGEHTAQEMIGEIWIQRGNKFMEQGQMDQALAAYKRVGVETWDDAVAIVRHALDEGPTLIRTRFYLSEILLKSGRTDEALTETNAALTAYQQMSSANQQEILAFFLGVLEKAPEHTLARLLLGQFLLIEGKSSEALSELERACEDDKSQNRTLITYILLVRAEAAHFLGEWLSALDDCVKILQVDPGNKAALEIMDETITQLQNAGIENIPDDKYTRDRIAYVHMGAKSPFGIERYRLYELMYVAEDQIRLLGVVALDPDWQTLVQKLTSKLREDSGFTLSVLCESDNTLFSKSLTYHMDAVEHRRNFQELQFIRDRALIEVPDVLSDQGIPLSGNQRISMEITHLPIPISIVQIDNRIFANLWLHDIDDRFEEIVPSHPWYSHIESYVDTYFDPIRGRKYACPLDAEVLEVFDHNRVPRGIYPRDSFYDTDYSQRVIWAFVFDRQGRMLIHRRADNAKDNQGMWDKSVGGHIEFSDMDTSHSAYREVIEELFVAEPEKVKADFKRWAISDEEVIYLGEWRPEQRKRYPFDEIRSFKREWAFFRYRESERLYSPRTLPDGTERRLRVIPDIFFFVAGPQLTDRLLDELANSTFKLIELPELKKAMDKALGKKEVPGFDKNRSGKGRPIPKFSPDLINIMTGRLYDVLVEFSQYIKRYVQQQ